MENNREKAMREFLTKEIDAIEVPKGLKEEMWSQVKLSRKKRRFPSKLIPFVAAIACLAILIPLGLSEIPFGTNVEQSTSGGETYTNETANVSTVIGEDWEQVDIPSSNPDSIIFRVEEQLFVEIHQSVLQITTGTGEQDSTVDILKTSFNESGSYQDFESRFLEKHAQFSGMSYEEFDVTEGGIPIYYGKLGESAEIFAVMEAENTPYFIYLSTSDPVESIKEQKYYTIFLEMLDRTKPLS
ncbi:hypothetical protein NC661_21130 [Aquibacillus koreensis]|uniref:Uncharacterized protein n=1 Tax=Aquibacillus koreensis TaxID=279446 RepID=A0A9X3WPN0_9BACI|nr:hypothetical protein [Aquibacillus koreensis]MCT2535308.1 hypothetical protein [Aquibacillus koreensis]MDC3422850.1 hypothetical protein [Aquibacillus koreensis]